VRSWWCCSSPAWRSTPAPSAGHTDRTWSWLVLYTVYTGTVYIPVQYSTVQYTGNCGTDRKITPIIAFHQSASSYTSATI
jgi:hypothetical protein